MKKSILIVEDVAAIQEVLKLVLELEDYVVYCAENGLDALKLIGELPSVPDLMLIDLHMPIMDGFQLIERIRETPSLHSIGIISMSALQDVRNVPKNPHIQKPIDVEHLILMIKQALENPVAVTDSLTG